MHIRCGRCLNMRFSNTQPSLNVKSTEWRYYLLVVKMIFKKSNPKNIFQKILQMCFKIQNDCQWLQTNRKNFPYTKKLFLLYHFSRSKDTRDLLNMWADIMDIGFGSVFINKFWLCNVYRTVEFEIENLLDLAILCATFILFW